MGTDSEGLTAEESAGQCCCLEHKLTDGELTRDVQLLSAMGSETRYEALRLIATRDEGVCVCELAPVLGVSQGAVSQALSRLLTAGLVTRRKEGRWRYYSVTETAELLLAILDEISENENEDRHTR